MKSNDTVFTFSCAHLQDREQKAKVPKSNPRDARRMCRFDCDGWLHITLSSATPHAKIEGRHSLSHDIYLDIQLPVEWREFIDENADTHTPGQVSRLPVNLLLSDTRSLLDILIL